VSSGNVSAFGGIFSMAVKAPDFAAFLELLQTQGTVHVLSSPRVSTVNNQKAVIKVGGDEFFVTGITNSSTVIGASTTQAPTVELTPFFSGIALDVTPQIDADTHVTLHIHPTVSDVSQKEKNFVVSGENFSLPLAFSTIQESDNVVRANTGQIIVIGGLMKEASTADSASIPLLGDVPVLGNLFKHQRLTRIKKELVILLKPTVMDDGNSWAEAILPAQKRALDLMGVRDR
jgi:MSHA biogenesis protein MshL